MVQNIAQIKQWFQTEKFPTQQQFYDWLESFDHKTDMLPIDRITGLKDMLQSINSFIANHNDAGGGGGLPATIVITPDAPTWVAPAGTLVDKIVIYESGYARISIGTAPGLADVMEGMEVQAPKLIATYDIDVPVQQQLFFNGMTANTIIKLYRR